MVMCFHACSLSRSRSSRWGRSKRCIPSVCQSVPCLRFYRNRKAEFEVWRSNVKVTGNERAKIVFSRTDSSKVDRFTSNQDQNDHRPILDISLNTFHQRKCFIFMIIYNQWLFAVAVHLLVNMLKLLLLFFYPLSTKFPRVKYWRLSKKDHNGVYSVVKVLWKETAFPRWRAGPVPPGESTKVIIIIITKIYTAHCRTAPNALTVSVRSSG